MLKTKTEPIKTILIIVLGLIILHLKFQMVFILYVALFICIGGVISSKLRKAIDFIWMKLAWVLSLIIPNIILSIIFYFILFPVAIIAKLFRNKNGIVLKNEQNSFFKDVNKEFKRDTFKTPW